jgi:hypothetical protein
MSKSKKKKPDHSKSKSFAITFSIAEIGILLIFICFMNIFYIDKLAMVGFWFLITISLVVFLQLYDRRAAEIFVDMLSVE